MSMIRREMFGVFSRPVRRGALVGLLATLAQAGCSREFYRNWANQDATEAVFEKSRDPRWRLDAFTIEPPARSRFASPYDPEFPPAPPDDSATEALSPVPQWPDNRLLVPAEATGYVDMMEGWMAEREEARARGVFGPAIYTRPGNGGRNGTPQPAAVAQPSAGGSPFAPVPAYGPTTGAGATPAGPNPPVPGALPPAGAAGPGSVPPTGGATTNPAAPPPAAPPAAVPPAAGASPGAAPPAAPAGPSTPATPAPVGPTAARNRALNSGTNAQGSSPILLASTESGKPKAIPPPRAAISFNLQELSRSPATKDRSVQRTAGEAAPSKDPALSRASQVPGGTQVPRDSESQPRPIVPRDPGADLDAMSQETRRQLEAIRPAGPGGTFSQEQVTELAGVLIPKIPPFNVAAAAGLPRNADPYVISMQQAFTLALINARIYQLQLETLYNSALAVTLQRFAFQPQFYAGLSPLTAPIGARFPGVVPANQFIYQTRVAPGGQISTLNMGEVAGFGKLLSTGGQLLMGFANQVVFNFVGKNPIQPTVQSSLPLTFIQPFLRGGGRAVTLEPLTQAERSLVYQTRSFAKFRQEFIVDMLTGGTIAQPGIGFSLAGFSTAGNTDPTVGFIPNVQNFAQVIIDLRNVAYFEQLAALYAQLIEGESSGLTQLQVDQVRSQVLTARSSLIGDILTLRNANDSFKQQLGLPPDTPIVPELNLFQPYLDTFTEIDEWQRRKDRKLVDIPKIVNKIPELPDIVLDGHSLLGMYKNTTTFDNEEDLEATLQAAVRIALEYRLDLMNTRAQLYDAWRQIRVKANALRGYLNVTLTNQVFTPPTTTNPFGFFSQAKQFSLVLNAELPLIRLAERNAFRQAIIAYEQERRALMSQEDFIKNQLRSDIRTMQVTYIQYQITKANLIVNVRLKDQAFEQIVAPPQAAAGTQALAQNVNAATQTSNLIGFQGTLIRSEIALTNAFAAYQLARLTVYRDIGTLPYDEWEAFSELFPAEYRGPSLGPGTSNVKPAAAAAALPPQNVRG
jgi:hypothetical protein